MAKKDWDPLVSRKKAAELLGVKSGTLEVWASTGRYDLPYVKVGGLAKYKLSVLKNFIESRSSSSAARF